MRKKISKNSFMTIKEFFDDLKNKDPEMKITLDIVDKVVRLNESYENAVITKLQHQLAVRDKAIKLGIKTALELPQYAGQRVTPIEEELLEQWYKDILQQAEQELKGGKE